MLAELVADERKLTGTNCLGGRFGPSVAWLRRGMEADVRQHVYIHTEESLLRYADLRLWELACWSYRHASYILAESVRRLIRALGQSFYFLVHGGWCFAEAFWITVVSRAIRLGCRPFVLIWGSPWWALWSSSMVFGAVWLQHTGYTAPLLDLLPAPTVPAGVRSQLAWALEAVLQTVAFVLSASHEGFQCVLQAKRAAFASLAGIERTSPLLACSTWVATVALSKFQRRVRVKSLIWPTLVVYVTVELKLVAIGIATSALWLFMSAVVAERYEAMYNGPIDEWQRVQRQRRQQRPQIDAGGEHGPVGPHCSHQQPTETAQGGGGVSEGDFAFGQTECPICLDYFGGCDGTQLLPCGHLFHRGCIGDWLGRGTNHCPLCRHAVGGIARMVEIVF